MPKLVITHAVADLENWLKGKDERAGALGAMGGSNVTDHVAVDGSKAVAVTADVQDVEAIKAGIASPPPELAEAMQRHGVVPPLSVYIEK